MNRKIKTCVYCDSAQVSIRTGSRGGKRGYYCDSCKRYAEEANTRETSHIPGRSVSGLARKLLEMDPDELKP